MLRQALRLLLATLLVSVAWAWSQDLPLDQIRVGDTGFGVTEGPRGLAQFDVEVLAIQQPSGPGFPTILIQTTGTFLDEVGGVAAGMSGSPIYLERSGSPRLIGALSYGFPNTNHRRALVTPIAAMRALAGPQAPRASGTPEGALALSAPLLVSGVTPRALGHLAPLFERAGHTPLPVQAGGAGAGAMSGDALVPGSAVGIALARGDVTIAAIGTVTDTEGDDILLLGHPLLQGGASDLALVPAEVIGIIASQTIPYKLANVGQDAIGRVYQDAMAGLAADLGQTPGDLPLTITVAGEVPETTLNMQVTRDPDLLPAVVATVTHAAIDGLRDAIRGGSAEVEWRIHFAQEDSIRLVEDRSAERDLAFPLARLSAAPIAVLTSNPFQEPNLAGIEVRITTYPTLREVEIVEVALETPSVKPGESVQAFVRLQPYRGQAEVRTLSISIPEDVTPGPLRLTLRGATIPDPERETLPADEERDPLEQAISDLPPIVSWAELLVALENRPKARELLIEIPGEDRPKRLARIDLGGRGRGIVTGVQHVTVTIEDPDTPASPETEEETP